jgi:hypothetical protein
MKKGKELKLDTFKNYNIVYGSVNNKNPKALYIQITGWVDPKQDDKPKYNRIIRELDKRVRQTIYNTLTSNITTPFLKERTIIDFDIRESGVKYGKRSFMNCEITLYLKDETPINSDNIKLALDYLIDIIITSVFERCRHFEFYKKKK